MNLIGNEMSIVAVLSAAVIFAIIVIVSRLAGKNHVELPERQAGRLGEKFVTTVISEILRDGDTFLTNVNIMVDGMQAELDNVVLNDNGVFIIEAKNYAGQMFGDEDDPEWIMSGPDMAQIPIVNPIFQVKRQILLTSKLIADNGIRARVRGFVFFVNMNSPVRSDLVLETRDDIDDAIHQDRGERTDSYSVCRLLGRTDQMM